MHQHCHHVHQQHGRSIVTGAADEQLVAMIPMEVAADLIDPTSGFTIGESWTGYQEGWMTAPGVAEVERCAVAAFLGRSSPLR